MTAQLEYTISNRMKTEVDSAAAFLMNLLRVRQKIPISNVQLHSFRAILAEILMERYQRHWYPEVPAKGSGYRCIRINGELDPLIEKAGLAAGLNSRSLRIMLPNELTMWIDPDEVCYRIGENGSVCILYNSSRGSPLSDIESKSSEENEHSLINSVRHIAISSDLKEFIINLYDEDTTVITKPRSQRHRMTHRNMNHKSQNYHPSYTSKVKVSPCSSPAHSFKQHQNNLKQRLIFDQNTTPKFDMQQLWDHTSLHSTC